MAAAGAGAGTPEGEAAALPKSELPKSSNASNALAPASTSPAGEKRL